MELYGSEISGPSLEAFFAVMRALGLLVGVASGVAFLIWRRTWLALAGVVLLVLIGWASSNYPSYRLYGLQYPGDRLRNLSWCATVAAGHSPFTTGTLGQSALEPLWPAVAGSLAMGRPEWVHHVFRFAPAVILVGLALVLYFHFGNCAAYPKKEGDLHSSLRGLLVAVFAVLLATPVLDFLGPFRGYWAKMFLLKPNHALGLLMIPFLVTLLAKDNWLRAAFAGLWLGLLGWVFIVHWGFVCVGVALYLVSRALLKKSLVREIPKAVVALILGLLIVSPYIYLIAANFPHAVTLGGGSSPEFPTRSTWGDILPTGSSLPFLVTIDQGLVFYLGLLGVVDWIRRGGRRETLWASMVVGAYLLWALNILFYFTARAREPDEFYFFLVFTLSVAAGNGAYILVSMGSVWVNRARIQDKYTRVAIPGLAVVAVTTLAFPYWWNPLKMDAHYRAGLEQLPRLVTRFSEWALHETKEDDIFISSSELGQWIPAMTGRRLLFPHREWKEEAHSIILERDYEPEWMEKTQTIYVLFDRSLSKTLKIDRDFVEESPRLARVYREGDVVVYKILRDSER